MQSIVHWIQTARTLALVRLVFLIAKTICSIALTNVKVLIAKHNAIEYMLIVMPIVLAAQIVQKAAIIVNIHSVSVQEPFSTHNFALMSEFRLRIVLSSYFEYL